MSTKRETVLKTIVGIRTDDTRAVSFRTMDGDGKTSLMLSVEDSSGTNSFFFEDAAELKLFAKRVAEQAELFIE